MSQNVVPFRGARPVRGPRGALSQSQARAFNRREHRREQFLRVGVPYPDPEFVWEAGTDDELSQIPTDGKQNPATVVWNVELSGSYPDIKMVETREGGTGTMQFRHDLTSAGEWTLTSDNDPGISITVELTDATLPGSGGQGPNQTLFCGWYVDPDSDTNVLYLNGYEVGRDVGSAPFNNWSRNRIDYFPVTTGVGLIGTLEAHFGFKPAIEG